MRIYEILLSNSTHHDDVAWEEQSLGEETEIPLRLVPGKETEELVEAIYTELEGEILDCNNCALDRKRRLCHPRTHRECRLDLITNAAPSSPSRSPGSPDGPVLGRRLSQAASKDHVSDNYFEIERWDLHDDVNVLHDQLPVWVETKRNSWNWTPKNGLCQKSYG